MLGIEELTVNPPNSLHIVNYCKYAFCKASYFIPASLFS